MKKRQLIWIGLIGVIMASCGGKYKITGKTNLIPDGETILLQKQNNEDSSCQKMSPLKILYFISASATIYLWLISLTASKEESILLPGSVTKQILSLTQ